MTHLVVIINAMLISEHYILILRTTRYRVLTKVIYIFKCDTQSFGPKKHFKDTFYETMHLAKAVQAIYLVLL